MTLTGQQWSLAAAKGEPGPGQDQETPGAGSGRGGAAGRRSHRQNPPKVSKYEEDVLPGEKGVLAAAGLQTHLLRHAG